MKILLIDDKRNLEVATHTARSYIEGILLLQSEPFDLVLLDHDLGDFHNGKEYTGYDILCWLEQNQQYLPEEIVLVTDNASARQKMQLVIDKIYNLAFER